VAPMKYPPLGDSLPHYQAMIYGKLKIADPETFKSLSKNKFRFRLFLRRRSDEMIRMINSRMIEAAKVLPFDKLALEDSAATREALDAVIQGQGEFEAPTTE
jgi:hypothetical protein